MVVELFVVDGFVEKEMGRGRVFFSFIVKDIVGLDIVSVSGKCFIIFFSEMVLFFDYCVVF